MAKKLTFEVLLEAAGRGKVDEWEQELKSLSDKRAELEAELDELRADIKQVQREIMKPVRAAAKAAKELGVEVPVKYSKRRLSVNGGSKGSYRWETDGLITKQEGVSRAMWRMSRGSGGSAGRDGKGILTAAEFWALVEEQTGKTEADLSPGEKLEVILPNGRQVQLHKTAG